MTLHWALRTAGVTSMIDTLSLVLKHILDPPASPEAMRKWRDRLDTNFPELANIEIAFDRPSDPYSVSESTINLFLYDVRENAERRINERTWTRSNGQVVMHPPPLRVACSYLVTAWSVVPTEVELAEQRLLGQVLQVLSGFPAIPAWFLEGTALDGQEPPLPMVTAQADGIQNPAEFWNAIGNKLRPSLTVTVTISMPVFEAITEDIVTTRFTGFDVGTGAVEETLIQIGGRVMDSSGKGIATAIVDILDAGLRTQTDPEGRYSFLRVPAGTHTIRVTAIGFEPTTQSLVVPGNSEDYEITLRALTPR
jgi:hypothetical protein